MIDSKALLADLQQRVKRLEKDLRERCQEHPDLESPLRAEFSKAKARERTGHSYEEWREELLTQIAAAWVLACVFVRFLEDNELVAEPRLAGPGPRLALARDHEEHFFQQHPKETVREYLRAVFDDVAGLPGMKGLFDERHNPLVLLGPSADGARELLEFWRRVDPSREGVALVHDFSDPNWSTRFLGDLYQDLSEEARARYALLQTPIFVEEFLLDRTLEPAVQEFGFREVKLIDPACGSGHFLLGAFERLFARRVQAEPATDPRVLAQRAIDQIAGVDLNPYAVAIARFRLLLEALRACGVRRLRGAPDFHLHVATGDSLLHGTRPHTERGIQHDLVDDPLKHHHYATEDAAEVERLLSQRYHVVVGNPPYITPKDAAVNQLYRTRFGSCHRKYSLAVTFMERFFDLALAPPMGERGPAGFVGTITTNAFMKREFGKKLVEEFIPRWDLSHVIDTSGAYIPGHGTPTVILLARNRPPVADTVRAVMGIRGEPATPEDPAKGRVWISIVELVDRAGSESEYVSVADVPRERFHKHPWSIGGGGAAELKERLEEAGNATLRDQAESIGFAAITAADELFVAPARFWRRHSIPSREFGVGDVVRDWSCEPDSAVAFMYEDPPGMELRRLEALDRMGRCFWPYRTGLRNRLMFGKLPEESGVAWYEYRYLARERFRTPLSIAFAFVATHNHFVLDRGGKVFKQSAPVIKLAPDAPEADHLGLLGLLNSSTACFWMKQVFFNKGDTTDTHGARITAEDSFANSYEHDGTKLQQFPVVADRPLDLARRLDLLAQERAALLPASLAAREVPTSAELREARERAEAIREEMIALQEELDWRCYRLYGVVEDELCTPDAEVPSVRLGERAFEIVLARKMAAGEIETQWFARHGSTPITEIPERWPAAYRALVQRRIEAIEKNPNVALIEQPEYKRRWNDEPWEKQEEAALHAWLCDRLEDRRHWPEPRLVSAATLADAVRGDPEFLQVAELYRGTPDFDLTKLVVELVEEEGVPFLPVLRYKESGLRKRALWERTWEKQRQEDAIDARAALPESDPAHLSEAEARATKAREVGSIEVPPTYVSTDFTKPTCWRHRGKLDVPKERLVLYPHAERDGDPTPVLTWAGLDALQQAQALATYALDRKQQEGWSAERLTPLLAGLLELLPWLRQWHNQLDPVSGQRLGDYFARFLDEECRALGLTMDDLRAWRPPRREGRRKRGG